MQNMWDRRHHLGSMKWGQNLPKCLVLAFPRSQRRQNKVFVFMKGNPQEPRCGFSNTVCRVLDMHGVNYNSCDVLEDNSIREGIKEFSKWPTIPQVYINGNFMGGCDILVEMHRTGELVEELKKVGIISAIQEKQEQSESKGKKSE